MIEGGIAQAVPEHPKRDHIFALSTAFGDAYLFQVSRYSQFYPLCIGREIVGPNSNHNSWSNISLDIALIH